MSKSIIDRNLVKINPDKTAFLLCDIQEIVATKDFFGFKGIIDIAKKMLAVAEALDCKLIVTEQYPKAFGKTLPELDIKRTSINQAKTQISMVTHEVLDQLKGIDQVVLFGIETHACILQTCLDLLRHDIGVYVIADGVSSAFSFEIPIAIQRMKSAGAVITSSESIIFELVRDSTHPNFKKLASIIKQYQQVSKDNPLINKLSSNL